MIKVLLAAELRRVVPEVGVVMLTTFSEDEYITKALDSGARGFLLKSVDPYELMSQPARGRRQGW